MTFEEYSRIKHDPVYVYNVEFGNKKVTYFGAEHTHDPQKPIFTKIEAEFKKVNPQIIFVEGMHFSQGGKQKAIEEYKNADRETVIQQHGESVFVFKLAVEAGIEVDSPEPSFKEEIRSLVDRGFNKDEIFACYGYRQANSMHRMADKSKFREQLNLFLTKVFKRDSQWEGFDYSVENLESIGKRIWGIEQGDLLVHYAFRASPVPYEDEDAVFTNVNRIAQGSSYFRDRYVIERIIEALKIYDRLFIIFGSSHAVMQEPALRYLAEGYLS